jgi:peptidoglycan/LPS O-acetylase OafA/YrhL
MQKIASKARLSYLDTARGLAALSVIVWHFFTAFFDYQKPSFITNSPLHFFWYGEADVIFFFIHSGFILTYAYSNFKNSISVSEYVKYLIERMFRIYPLFLFVLVLSFIFKNTVYPLSSGEFTTEHLQKIWSSKKDLSTFFKEAILFIRMPDNTDIRLIPQDWTLAVELLVCPLIPILSFLCRRYKWFYWPVVFLFLKLFHVNTYAFEFSVGVFIFHIWDNIEKVWLRINRVLKWVLAVIAVVLYTCFFKFCPLFESSRFLFRPGIDRFIVVSGCALFFAVIISSSTAKKIMSHHSLVKIGRVCYSIYLIHMLLLICFADVSMRILYLAFNFSFRMNILIEFLVFLFLTITISLGTYNLIERPCNKLGKIISKRVARFIEPLESKVRNYKPIRNRYI